MKNSLEELYKSISKNCTTKEDIASKNFSLKILKMQNFFLPLFDYDPVTNDSLSSDLDSLLARTCLHKENVWCNDRLENILDYAKDSIFALFDILHEKNVREYQINHPSQVHEVDGKCIRYLAKKPGRSIRQKIASEQKLMGVYHRTSLDTSENRLFKAFVFRIDELLFEKEKAAKSARIKIGDETEIMLSRIHHWLYSYEAELIGNWNNLPPNNTLLNDKNYRKIWKAWQFLKSLDEQCKKDVEQIAVYENTRNLLWFCGKINESESVRFCQQPVFFDKENFKIKLLDGFNVNGFYKSEKELKPFKFSFDDSFEKVKKSFPKFSDIDSKAKIEKQPHETNFAAIDFSSINPFVRFSNTANAKKRLGANLIFQEFSGKHGDNETKEFVPCLNSRMICQKKNVKTCTIHSFLKNDFQYVFKENPALMENAARRFARTVSEKIPAEKFCYILPDDVDDFSPVTRTLRQNLNVCRPKVESLPRSIAAVFSRLDKLKLKDGQEFYVVDKRDSYWILTKIKAEFNSELKEKKSKTNGFVYERFPSIIIPEDFDENGSKQKENIIDKIKQIFLKNDWQILGGNFTIEKFHFFKNKIPIDANDLENEILKITKNFYRISIDSDEDVTSGCFALNELQAITPDIPLWKEHLPPLKMEYFEGIETKHFQLVGTNHSVRPIAGIPVEIKINAGFMLPAQKEFYQFPLIQGDGKARQKYAAFIKHSDFPLQEDTICRLRLTYTFGNEIPYRLIFIPQKDISKRYEVEWIEADKVETVQNYPSPNFVKEYNWEELQNFPNKNNDGTVNIQNELLKELETIPKYNVFPIVKIIPNKNFNENVSCFIEIRYNQNAICYINSELNPQIGDKVLCFIQESGFDNYGRQRYKAKNPLLFKNGKLVIKNNLFGWQKFLAINFYAYGRSIYDHEDLTNTSYVENAINFMIKKIAENEISEEIKKAYIQLLCIMIKDVEKVYRGFGSLILKNYFNNNSLDEYFLEIAHLIGDCSCEWQEELFVQLCDAVVQWKNKNRLVRMLAISIWQAKDTIYKIPENLVAAIIELTTSLIENEFDKKNPFLDQEKKRLSKCYSSCLEIILGFCRLRELNNEKINNALSPTNKAVDTLLKNLDKLKKYVLKDNLEIPTFLKFEIKKNESDQTPDLLYATIAYLSGKVENNSIRVLEANFE